MRPGTDIAARARRRGDPTESEAAMRSLRLLLVLGACLIAWIPFARAAEEVDLLLVLAVDVSRSIDQPKFQLQRDGYVAAVSDRGVLDAIRSGPHQKIALSFVEWSGAGAEKLLIDWTIIDAAASARRFGDQLVEFPRSFADRTSISGALEFAAAQIARAPFTAPRHVVDVSGDGTNNAGRDVQAVRGEVVAKGITINGLVILTPQGQFLFNADHTNPPGGLEKYYRDNVIGGPGAFVMVAEDFNAFGKAIIKKLIAEIAWASGRRTASAR
jgi:hypothetical protein